jgi:hypothetical protein
MISADRHPCFNSQISKGDFVGYAVTASRPVLMWTQFFESLKHPYSTFQEEYAGRQLESMKGLAPEDLYCGNYM